MIQGELTKVEYVAADDGFVPQETPLSLTGATDPLNSDVVIDLIKEGNDSYQIHTDSAGRGHETMVLNADQAHRATILRPGTSWTNIVKNPGWFYETALLAAYYPNARIVTWGSFNNDPTGHMHTADLRHVAQTGRYTKGDGNDANPYRAVDSFKEMVGMLHENDLLPTHFVADQEAGRLVLPMMVELDTDSVQGASLNGINGISPVKSYVAAPFMDDLKSRVHRRRNSSGELDELSPDNLKGLKALAPDIYHGWRKAANIFPVTPFAYPLGIRDKMWYLERGYRSHNKLDNPADHAVMQDMLAALGNQDITMSLQFNQKSSQHNLADVIEFGKMVMDRLPDEDGQEEHARGVELILGAAGGYVANTDAQEQAAVIRRFGLPGITPRMALFTGGLAFQSLTHQRNVG